MVTSAPSARSTWTGLAARMVLTLVGAAGLIIGAFLDWTRAATGVDLGWEAFFRTDFSSSSDFLTTVGAVMIGLGLLAIVGLASRTGWLGRIAGALGIAGFVLFAIQLYRSSGDDTIGPGAWICLAGAAIALIAGFMGVRAATTTTTVVPAAVVPGATATTTTTTHHPADGVSEPRV